jgi:hypothetical protein
MIVVLLCIYSVLTSQMSIKTIAYITIRQTVLVVIY